jgi:hypothetical protein
MQALGIVSAYLLVGFLVSRRVFVNTLGDHARIRERSYGGYTFWSSEFTAAVWWAIAAIPAWPLVGPLRLVFHDTPHEKTVKRQAELKKLEDKLREVEQEFNLKFDLKFDPERMGK